MKKLDYQKLMALNPTLLYSVKNKLGQQIYFFEHPTRGDDYPVIAVYHKEKTAVVTDFCDCDDFFVGSEYNPCYKDGKWTIEWEL